MDWGTFWTSLLQLFIGGVFLLFFLIIATIVILESSKKDKDV